MDKLTSIFSIINYLLDWLVSIPGWIETHSDFVIAAATGAIALFTWTLYRATRKLWKVSQEQSKDMKTSLAIARESADAATNTVNIMKDTAEKQLRAYLSVRIDHVFCFSDEIIAQIRFIMLNHGQTPAYNVTQTALIEILPYPLPPDYQLPNLPEPPDTTYVLHPTATLNGFVRAIRLFSKEEINRIINNNGFRIYILGLVKYKDGFGINRQTKFCCSVTGDENLARVAQGVPLDKDVPIKFEPCKQHNEAN